MASHIAWAKVVGYIGDIENHFEELSLTKKKLLKKDIENEEAEEKATASIV